MQQNWTLDIKKFAKIENAKIKIAPFLVFIGENNSGKSYIMTLLWGLYVLGRNIFFKEAPSVNIYKECLQIIDNALNSRREEIELNQEEMLKFINFYNYVLEKNRNKMLKDIFSTDSLSIKSLEIKDYKRDENLKVKFVYNKEARKVSSGKNYIRFPIIDISKNEKYKIIQYICWKLLMQDLNSALFPYTYSSNKIGTEPLFLPASRTGFMLTYKLVTSSLMDILGYDKEINANFTLPVIKFLQSLIVQKESKKYPKEIIDFLEKEILKGNIISKENLIKEYTYKPQNLKQDISLHITSSLVVELAPLIILLKSNLKYESIFIEELEAHLHPEIQKIITRVIIRLLNSGYHIVITTHSDIIFQHINNMIKLSYIKNRDKILSELDYEKNDILNPKDIKVYEFKIIDNKTEVKPLKLTKEGFEVPSFNNALIDLAKETMIISEAIDE